MQLSPHAELAYCTNIHPAESWAETWDALKTYTLKVRDLLRKRGLLKSDESYAIGLRLSAQAATELEAELPKFKEWLKTENCTVFTINGFPYGAFHGTRVKEKVYNPDWATPARVNYTKSMARVISTLNPAGSSLSISTLPGSFKAFNAYEPAIMIHLIEIAEYFEELSLRNGQDLHLGLEPEPIGYFENLEETITFFKRLISFRPEKAELIRRRIGVNYDTCHFALEYEDCHHSLKTLLSNNIRISKVHLSNALTFDPQNSHALVRLRDFDEPTYLHQVLVKDETGRITRFTDIPEFFERIETHPNNYTEGRCHFHIPLYEQPTQPFGTTLDHAKDALAFLNSHPKYCPHFEIETYTWGVMPEQLLQPIDQMIAEEYQWVLKNS